MPRDPASPAKRLEWAPRARAAYWATLAHIADQDPFSAQQVKDRLEQALRHIVAFPAIGTPTVRRGVRRYPIPNTGHVINYRITRSAVRIQTWYRARRGSQEN